MPEKLSDKPYDVGFNTSRIIPSVHPISGEIYKIDAQKLIELIAASSNASFRGKAITSTNPGTVTSPVWYIAGETGTYTLFKDSDNNPVEITSGDVNSNIVLLSINAAGVASKQLINVGADLSAYVLNTTFNVTKSDVADLKTHFSTQNGNNDFVIMDDNGRIGLKFTDAGIIQTNGIDVENVETSNIDTSKLNGNNIINDNGFIIAVADENDALGFGVRNNGDLIAKKAIAGSFETLDGSPIGGGVVSPWKGKTIVWYGTSIPTGGQYVQKIADALGATVIKRTQSGSRCKIRWSGTQAASNYNSTFHQALSDWSETLAEKQWIIDNYASIYPYLTDTADPKTPTPTQMAANAVVYTDGPYGAIGCQDVVKRWSFEYNLVGEFLNPSSGYFNVKPDLIVIDHGYNDLPTMAEYTTQVLLNTRDSAQSGYTAAAAASRDRQTFASALAYILDQLYKYDSAQLNTFLPIVMIGHYTRYDPARKQSLCMVQEQVAQYWDIPICKVWEKTHTSDQVAINSQQLWSVSPWSNYTSGQDTAHDMTIHNVWIPDRIHPHSDPLRRMDRLMEKIILNFLQNTFTFY